MVETYRIRCPKGCKPSYFKGYLQYYAVIKVDDLGEYVDDITGPEPGEIDDYFSCPICGEEAHWEKVMIEGTSFLPDIEAPSELELPVNSPFEVLI